MVEKMEFIRITGPREDIDRVNEKYLQKYDVHLENALSELNDVPHIKPFVEVNPYKTEASMAEVLVGMIGEKIDEKTEHLEISEAVEIVEEASKNVNTLTDEKETMESQKKHLEQLIEEIEPFRLLNYELHKILDFHFIRFRFGRIAHEYFQKFEKYGYDNLNTIFYECDRDDTYVWGVYFVPNSIADSVDAIYSSLHFERLYIADEYEGTPEHAYQLLNQQLEQLNINIQVIEERVKDQLVSRKDKITRACATIRSFSENFEIRKMAACTKERRYGGVFYILCGWMRRADAVEFLREIEDDSKVFCLMEREMEDLSVKPPTKLKNPGILKPFEMFIKMYGLPAYKEIDPTLFVAITYTLMFGIMFGDVGQGALLVIGGFLVYRFKKIAIAGIISVAGLWSVFFGFMYGSVFGNEEVLTALWMKPNGNIMQTLIMSVEFGVVLILIAMLLHVVNAIREHDLQALLFDQSGLAGIVCYGTVALAVILIQMGYPMPGMILLGILVGLPLLAIMLKEPLGRMLKKKRALEPGTSIPMFIVEALVEVFDVVLSYATNTISFVRVGAFALSHAGMMKVVYLLAGASSGSPNILVLIIGNLVIIGLEGLVVGIQVLRLEYYEMFSRFYKGTGKAFVPFRKNNNVNNI